MESNKYIDKVIGSLVRGTKIDYEKNLIVFPFPDLPLHNHATLFFIDSLNYVSKPPPFFRSYCKNTFGLTEDECRYVFIRWREIMKDNLKDER